MKKQYHLTKDGIRELKEELKELIDQRGPIAERIKTAREFGDLAENAEYSAARQEQEKVESRISEIEHILQNVEVIKQPKNDGSVRLGSTVKLSNEKKGSREYQIVGTIEADPLNGKISDESPIGQALLGRKKGDSVDVKVGTDNIVYKIVSIA